MRLPKSAIIAFFIALAFSLAATIARAQSSSDNKEFVSKTLYPAVALLYSQDDSGDLRMRCTATAIEKKDGAYTFVTAAHCACDDDTETRSVSPEKTFFYITADDSTRKEFMKAALSGCGYRHRGDDFAFFTVTTENQFPVVELGEDPKALDSIVNVASPLGLGKQSFIGSVSSASLDRPVIVEDINWTHAVLLQLFGTDGGSSGSAFVCLDQKKICGLVVGTIDKTTIVGVPVSRLIKVKNALADGIYKNWKDDPDAVEPHAKEKKK